MNAVNIFWTTFLSFIANSKNRKTAEKTEETVVDVSVQKDGTQSEEVKVTDQAPVSTENQLSLSSNKQAQTKYSTVQASTPQ